MVAVFSSIIIRRNEKKVKIKAKENASEIFFGKHLQNAKKSVIIILEYRECRIPHSASCEIRPYQPGD